MLLTSDLKTGGANQIGRGGADRPDFTKLPENIAGRGVNGK